MACVLLTLRERECRWWEGRVSGEVGRANGEGAMVAEFGRVDGGVGGGWWVVCGCWVVVILGKGRRSGWGWGWGQHIPGGEPRVEVLKIMVRGTGGCATGIALGYNHHASEMRSLGCDCRQFNSLDVDDRLILLFIYSRFLRLSHRVARSLLIRPFCLSTLKSKTSLAG